MTSLLANILVSGVLQLGVIPGHTMALYGQMDQMQYVDVHHTVLVDYQAEAEFWKHGFISGGFTSYSLPAAKGFDFYPFRADYDYGAGARAGRFELGYSHLCMHPLAPNMERFPLPMVNGGYDMFYLKIKMGGRNN
jgi:hypothetical protein